MEDNQENKEIKENKKQEENLELEVNAKQEVENQQEANDENQTSKEMIEVKNNKKQRKGSYILGTLGAILGGMVGILPWIIRYIFAKENFVLTTISTLFAAFIPLGAYLGYKLFRGRIGKPCRGIITIVSLLIIILVTNIICPLILLYESSYYVNLENLIGLYTDENINVRRMLMGDFIGGLSITILGIVITIKLFINKNLQNILEEERKARHKKVVGKLKEQDDLIKRACIDLNCMSKEKSVKKDVIIEQLKIVYNIKPRKAKVYFKNCKINKLLRKYKGKYYYDETDAEIKIENVKKVRKTNISALKVIALILITAIIGTFIAFILMSNYTIPDTNVKLSINPITQELYGTKEDIAKNIGTSTAEHYNFIIEEKDEKYEISGQLIEKSIYEESEITDVATVIQQDRDYFASYFGEEETSQVEDKELGGKNFKFYYYNYISNTNKECRTQVYLYEMEEKYLWVEVRTIDNNSEVAEIDEVIAKLFK